MLFVTSFQPYKSPFGRKAPRRSVRRRSMRMESLEGRATSLDAHGIAGRSFNVSTTLTGETTDGTQILGASTVDLFMCGKALRELLDSL